MATTATDETGAAMAKQQRRRVLLVEDEDDVREAGTLWLSEHGFEVASVDGGQAALDRLQEELPDVVVLDLMMPGVNGWDVWDWLQAGGRRIPVIVWTSTGLRSGAIGDAPIVPKGRPAELLEALRRVFGAPPSA